MAPKYRQRGYKDDNSEGTSKKRPPKDKDVFRGRSEGRFREEVFRCHECNEKVIGHEVIDQEQSCTKCGADVHSCKNCLYFNPVARNECQKEISKRIPKKAKRNECELFGPRIVLDLISPKGTTSAEDARKAFDSLFKK